MIPKRVTLENFLSFGEKQEIVFDHDHVLWIIGGPNGSGKSAVFDAMTYCLFGTHRASGTRIKDSDNKLIRHGENDFSILFEFEFNGIDYRIGRGRNKGAGRQPTPTVENRTADGKWERIANVNTVKELDSWVVNTLGLNSEQFQASVLLRQGEADAFVNAKPTARFEILKGIINMEQYERLAELVGTKLGDATRNVKSFQKQLEGKTSVSAQQLEMAKHQADQAEAEKIRCEEAVQQANTNKERAVLWNKLQADRDQLESLIQNAKKLDAQAEQIDLNHNRWKQLSEILPRLKSMIELRSKLERKNQELSQIQAAIKDHEMQWEQEAALLKTLTDELQQLQINKAALEQRITQLTADGKELSNRHKAALELSVLQNEVNKYADLQEEKVHVIKESQGQAVFTHANAKDEVTRQRTIFSHAEQHHAKISKLMIGVNCSACGQPVTAEHAEKEKQNSSTNLAEAKQALDAAEQTLSKADQEARRLTTDLEDIQKQWNLKIRALDKLETTRNNYQDYGELEQPDVLGKKINDLRQQYQVEEETLNALKLRMGEVEPLQKKSNASLETLDRNLNGQNKELQTLYLEVATLTGQLDSARELMPEALRSATKADTDQLDNELRTLTQSNIEQQLQQLTASRNQLAIRQSQLQSIENDLNNIPEAARISNEKAMQLFKQAGDDKSNVEKNWQTARDQCQLLMRQAEEYQVIVKELARLEHQQTLLKLLDEKLGKKGLQLAMMQDAQVQIVELARQTLLQLSNHELSLELNQPDGDTTDQALDLCVRHAENAHVTPMEYLSGSQKFRVAIAIALAIGRYSAGQSRPLESVIIDEGFGSLDRDGLNAMAEELQELQRSQLLRRIILVSHQEEFADRFSAGYSLSPSDQGTRVKLWRR